MRRIREQAPESAADAWDRLCDSRKEKPKRKPSMSDRVLSKLIEEAKEFARTGEWANAAPRHFFALFEWLHREVYGIESFTTPTDRLGAVSAVASMLTKRFDDDPTEMARFVRWTWKREKSREDWRRENERDGGRITWRIQFSGSLYGEWRLACMRKVPKGAA